MHLIASQSGHANIRLTDMEDRDHGSLSRDDFLHLVIDRFALRVIERQAGALQQSHDVMLHIPEVLNRTGHGLVVYEKGLNTLAKEAVKAGTPVATIYRDLDGADQNERTIRRFLDGAAFRAANSPSEPIVVLARLRPETMSAILIWALQDRAQKTAVVPVSQLMKAGLQN